MPDAVNDAAAYGVRVVAAVVSAGADYWRVVRVHHLTPAENGQRHHIFMDLLDPDGKRVFGGKLRVGWEGGGRDVVVDKPLGEPGANEPMWKWQVCHVSALGLPSDRVENLHTTHPDESSGNTLFHHSFHVVFQRAKGVAGPPPQQSSITGAVPGGAGHTLVLANEQGSETRTQVADNELYRFEKLAAGAYTITDSQDNRRIGPIVVDGMKSVVINFPAPPAAPRLMASYVLFGPIVQATTQTYLSLLAERLAARRLSFGFSLEDAVRSGDVLLVGQHTDATRAALTAAGVRFQQLPTEPGALLEALS